MVEHIVAFFVYSYLGATCEHIAYNVVGGPDKPKKSLENPIITGFPIYGIGAYIVVFANNYLKQFGATNPLIKILVFGFLLSALELVIGLIVGAGPKSYTKDGLISGWDYSNDKYNLYGIISPRTFATWGILGLTVSYIHPSILNWIKCGVNCYTSAAPSH